MGLQFENLVLNNRKSIQELLHLTDNDIINENPYFQRQTKSHKGCQIDYMIQTRFNTLYIIEMKFLKSKVGMSIIDEMQAKIDAIKLPRGMSIRTALIHVNGVTKELLESNFFGDIIDINSLLY